MRNTVAAISIVTALLLTGNSLLPCVAGEISTAELPQLFGTFKPEVGIWSQYAVEETSSGKKTQMRMAIVGKEDGSFWYEVHQSDGEHDNIIKMLVTGNPNNPDNIRRLILKSGDRPAAEMPKDFVAMGRRMAIHMYEQRSGMPADAEPDELQVKILGEKEVTVPAGTFTTEWRRIVDASGKILATTYFNSSIPPFGVVSSDTGSTRMELLAYGRDAVSAITENPTLMVTPPGMPTGMPRGAPPGLEPGRPKP